MGCFQVLSKDAYVRHRLWLRFLRFFFAVRGSHGQPIIIKVESIKKSVGAKTFAYPGCLGSRIAHLSRISNARSPRWIIYTQNIGIVQTQYQHWIYKSHERESLLYHAIGFEFARFKQPADKAPIRRYSYMSVTL